MSEYLDVLTAEQAAEIKGVTRRAIYDAIHTGKIKADRFGRTWLIKREELDKYKPHQPGRKKKPPLPPEEDFP